MKRALIAIGLLAACKGGGTSTSSSAGIGASATVSQPPASASGSNTVGEPLADARGSETDGRGADAFAGVEGGARGGDAGTSACLLLQGPSQQAYRGAGQLAGAASGVDVVLDDAGNARVAHVATAAHAVRDRLAQPPADASSLPCAVAGDTVFCPDAAGAIHRSTRAGGGGAGDVVAHALRGTRIDAVLLGGKPLVAYLVSKKTEEEGRSVVQAVADGAPPFTLSDEGATSFTLFATAAGAMLLSVDARSALTSVRAAPVAPGTPPTVGEETVVYVGGPPAGTELAADVATNAAGARVALLPISKDFSTFAMALIPIDDPPRADEPVAWSEYPNGMPRAPVAATRGAAKMTVARLRPAAAATGAPRVLELGRVDDHGGYASFGLVETRGEPESVAIRDAGDGSLWLLYTDAEGTWVERRRCP